MTGGLGRFKQDVYFDPQHNVHRLWNIDIDALINQGWTGQQISKFAPQLGIDIGSKPQARLDSWAPGSKHIGQSGLLNLGAAAHYISKGRSLAEIMPHGLGVGKSPLGRGTGDWKAGFTENAANFIQGHFDSKDRVVAQEAQIEQLEQPKIPSVAELMASIPTPKIRSGKDYATTGVRAQGMKIRHGSKFASGGNRGTRSYFSKKAKYSGSAPTMNIAVQRLGAPGSQANSTLNTA